MPYRVSPVRIGRCGVWNEQRLSAHVTSNRSRQMQPDDDNDNGDFHPGGTPGVRMFQHLHSREGVNGGMLIDTALDIIETADPEIGVPLKLGASVIKAVAQHDDNGDED
jgi:hypothetical protein